jgi:hypothetical protein
MEITRNNLNVVPQSSLEGLVTLDKVNTYNYNCIDKTLSIDALETWVNDDDVLLDALISTTAIETTFIKVISNNVVINSIREFQKKYKKKSSIKNKIESYVYDKEAKILICTVDSDWSEANTVTLDGVIDTLVGYDVVTQLMNGYEHKEKDGHNYYNFKRSQLVESIITAARTEEEAFEIDTKIVNVKNALLTGDWKTSKKYLEMTVVEGAYTQLLKDEFDLEITEYIDTHY